MFYPWHWKKKSKIFELICPKKAQNGESTTVVTKEMKTNSTVTCHCWIHQDSFLHELDNTKCCQGYGGIGSHLHCWWESVTWQLWKTTWQVPSKLKESATSLSSPLQAYAQENWMKMSKQNCTWECTTALFMVPEGWRQSKGSWHRRGTAGHACSPSTQRPRLRVPESKSGWASVFCFIFCAWVFCLHLCLCTTREPGGPEGGIGSPRSSYRRLQAAT